MSDKDTPMTNDSATVDERYPRELRVSYEGGRPSKAIIDGIEFAPATLSQSDVGDIVERLEKIVNDPFDGGSVAPCHLIEAAAKLRRLSADNAAKDAQINELAEFIMHEVDGEPSENQGAVDTAIRVIRALQAKVDEAREALEEASDFISAFGDEWKLSEKIDATLSNLKAGGE